MGADRVTLCVRKDEMFEEKAPDEVEPTEGKAEESDQNRDDERDEALRFEEGRPSDDDLNEPVHDGDQEQDDLDESALLVEPCSHNIYLLLVDTFIVHGFMRFVKVLTKIQIIFYWGERVLFLIPPRAYSDRSKRGTSGTAAK